jgi:hypothetical protein
LTIGLRTNEEVRKVVMKNECVSCKGEYSNPSGYVLPVLPNGEMGYCASCRKEVMQLESMYGEHEVYRESVSREHDGSINMLERRFNQWRQEKRLRFICEVIAQINQYR